MLTEGTKAPAFCLFDQDENRVCLKDFLGKWVILYFYPKDNTPGCSLEGKDFTALSNKFAQYNAVILGVSPDSPRSHCSFQEKQGITIPLLSDQSKEVLKKYGAWGKKKNYGREYEGVIRSTFLIDPKGIIRRIWSPVKVKGHAETVLATLEALQK